MHQLNYHELWQYLVWKDAYCPSCSFFYHPILSSNLPNMFSRCCGIQGDSCSMFSNFSNSMSIIEVWTIKPALLYILTTCLMLLAKHFAVLDYRNSIIIRLIPLEEVTRKGKPLTNITSATIVTYLCISTKSQEIFT